MSKFQEFHDENSSQRSTTHLHAPPSDVEVAGSQAPPPPPGPSPQELAVQKKLKRIQWILTGACVLLWLLIIVILIIYGTRKRCSTVKSIVDDVIIIEGSKSGSLITLILYAQNWLVTEDCYRGWSSTPTSKPLYTIGTIGLYDFDGLTISNYRQLWQRRYDLAFGAIFSFGAVAQEGGWLHFVATTGNALPTLFSYNVASGALQQTAIDALQWGFVTFGTDTSQPYLYYINNDLYGRMVTMNGIDYSQEWAFDDIYLLFPEATGYYNGTQLVANAVSVNGTGQSEVDYEVLPNLTVNQFPTPWARANGSEVISVYFDIQNDMRVLIGPLASSAGRRPGDSCLWWQGGVVTAVSESWAQQVCDGAIFEPVPGVGYSLVDVVNQVEIIIPYLNDWEIVAVTWIAQPAYTAKLWFDPSRGDRKYTTRPYVLTSAATPQGVYLPGYFPEDG